LTPSQWWDSTWKDVANSVNARGKYLTYDYRFAKPECVDNIKQQGACGSCWAFASVTAAQYRMCRGFKELSQMDLLCNMIPDAPCAGGSNTKGMEFIAMHGALSYDDFKYPGSAIFFGKIDKSQCASAKSKHQGTRHKLVPGLHYYVDDCEDGAPGVGDFPWKDSCSAFGVTPGCSKDSGGKGCYCDTHSSFRKHCKKSCGACQLPKGAYPFRAMVAGEPDFNDKVKYELMNYGPVPISIAIYRDWDFHKEDPACWMPGGGIPMSRKHDKSCCWKNRGGIFTNKEDRGWCDERVGKERHAMVITGWGEMNGVPFWQIQNSHGLDWAWGGEMRIAMDYLRAEDKENDMLVTISLPYNWKPTPLGGF